ncbi:MAG: biotin/lipoyl-binding protein [Actinobacteria bacterium]|nr:biotin/lipoyl-binding protein [Actinomycetota bacterium]
MSRPAPDPAAIDESPPPRHKRLTKRRVIGLVAIVAVLGIGLTAFLLLRPSSQATGIERTRTFSAQAERSTQTQTVTLTGTLAPQTQANLNFSVSGTITKVYVTAGDTVTKGQKLAKIDDADLQNALELAEANLDTAEANLDEVQDNDGSSAAITSAKAQVRSAKASVASAESDLENAVLRSTIAGTVASIDLSVGDTVSSGSSSGSSSPSASSSTSSSAQVVVISTDEWRVDASTGSSDLVNLKPGQAALVTPDGGEAIEATVASIGIVSTGTSDGSATFPVVVDLTGEHPDLFSGTNASVTVTVAEYPDVLTVATMAIATQDGRSVVNKVEGDSTTQVEVTVGRVFGDATEITAGLAEGDTVQISFTTPELTQDTGEQGGFGGGFPGGGGGFPDGGGAPPAGGIPGGNGGGNR